MRVCRGILFSRQLLKKRFLFGLVTLLLFLAGWWIYSLPVRFNTDVQDEATPTRPPIQFKWLALDNITSIDHCRNSRQGHTYIVDELGYCCYVTDVLASGCCNTNPSSQGTVRYKCDGCHDNGCCSVYEHCVSCCLHPGQKPVLQSVLKRNRESFHPLYSSLQDQYELCLFKCRTSSQSVEHENSYRNPQAKHCYGVDEPVVLPAEQHKEDS